MEVKIAMIENMTTYYEQKYAFDIALGDKVSNCLREFAEKGYSMGFVTKGLKEAFENFLNNVSEPLSKWNESFVHSMMSFLTGRLSNIQCLYHEHTETVEGVQLRLDLAFEYKKVVVIIEFKYGKGKEVTAMVALHESLFYRKIMENRGVIADHFLYLGISAAIDDNEGIDKIKIDIEHFFEDGTPRQFVLAVPKKILSSETYKKVQREKEKEARKNNENQKKENELALEQWMEEIRKIQLKKMENKI